MRAALTWSQGAVQEALDALFAIYPTLRESLTPPSGNVLEATNLFLNEQDVATLEGLDSPLADGDTLTILPAMSGGGWIGELVGSTEGLWKDIGSDRHG